MGQYQLYTDGACRGNPGPGGWAAILRDLIDAHVRETRSTKAQEMLRNWEEARAHFVQVCPLEMVDRLTHPLSDKAAKVPAE